MGNEESSPRKKSPEREEPIAPYVERTYPILCYKCDGKSYIYVDETCNKCSGQSIITIYYGNNPETGQSEYKSETCSSCNGKGYSSEKKSCPNC